MSGSSPGKGVFLRNGASPGKGVFGGPGKIAKLFFLRTGEKAGFESLNRNRRTPPRRSADGGESATPLARQQAVDPAQQAAGGGDGFRLGRSGDNIHGGEVGDMAVAARRQVFVDRTVAELGIGSLPPRVATRSETAEFGSPRSPKNRAFVGHTMTQAGRRSSGTMFSL